jgi:glycosyltransferase involved in cell wall biosynthesis
VRIALVIGTLNIGGTETQVCRLAGELKDRGHLVKVFALIAGGPLEEELRTHSIPFEIFHYPGFVYRDHERGLMPRQFLTGFTTLARFCRSLWRFDAEVCHGFLPWSYMVSMPAAAIGRVPARLAARRSLPSTLVLGRPGRMLQRVSVTTAHAIVANSQAVADDCARSERGVRRKLHVIPNGVDVADDLSNVGVTPAQGLMVANLIAYKGHVDLLTALAMLADPPTVHLVGDGPERGRLEAMAAELGLRDVVRFEGRVRGARDLFAHTQFGILASHEEGMPNAVLEAMGHGVPVVATAVGGIPELIEHNVNGLLVRSHDPAALASAIGRIAGDADLRMRLGRNARGRALDLSWGRCVEAYEALYARLLAYHGHRGLAAFSGENRL